MTERTGHQVDQAGHEVDHGQPSGQGHGGHRLLMIACCLPMLVIVALLVATGAAGAGAIIFALVCTAIMALMMFTMPGGHRR